jgi:NADH-quinone oxidoreductase subunit L
MVEFAMYHAWLIPLLPALAFLGISLLTRPWPRLSAYLACGSMLIGFVLAASAAVGVFTNPELIEKPLVYAVRWFSMPGLFIEAGVQLDPTSTMMLVMVTLVGSLIFIYSIGYMHGDKGESTFFAYLSLFAAMMLGLVISSNLLQMFLFWEGVGLCSYLLIGFWWHKISAREAAKKAFVTCRVADFGLLLGLIALYLVFDTLNIVELGEKIPGFHNTGLLLLIAVLFFLGPIGKSGQFPLHVWLPDAMEGPTPVSALIHAATMVVAGVYLVGRVLFLFAEVPAAMEMVAVVGGFTAFFAATIAIAQREIKRILAYSTISQIGYMMLALGVGSLSASMFHLWTHAYFKALLFLAAGSVLHALHDRADVWEMGGLVKKMPITTWTFVTASLAIAGIPPLSGFWSKDEILTMTLAEGHLILFLLASFTAFLTAFYMWRLTFLAFFGPENPENHPHESPPVMTVPLMLLAFFSVVVGWIGTPWWPFFGEWIRFGEVHHEANYLVMVSSTLLGVAGILLAWYIYHVDRSRAYALAERFKPVYKLLWHKYYIDELYLWFNHTFVDGAAKLLYLFDIYIVDGVIVNGIGFLTRFSGAVLRLGQTGQLQTYALVLFLGVLALAVLLALGGSSAGLLTLLGGVK